MPRINNDNWKYLMLVKNFRTRINILIPIGHARLISVTLSQEICVLIFEHVLMLRRIYALRCHACTRTCVYARICFDTVGDDYQVRIWSNVRRPEAWPVNSPSHLRYALSFITLYTAKISAAACELQRHHTPLQFFII